jgi:hypothetical protein
MSGASGGRNSSAHYQTAAGGYGLGSAPRKVPDAGQLARKQVSGQALQAGANPAAALSPDSGSHDYPKRASWRHRRSCPRFRAPERLLRRTEGIRMSASRSHTPDGRTWPALRDALDNYSYADLWALGHDLFAASETTAGTWACGWAGKRCLRLDCSKAGPCDGFKNAAPQDSGTAHRVRGDASPVTEPAVAAYRPRATGGEG